jgi:hypothetical protein
VHIGGLNSSSNASIRLPFFNAQVSQQRFEQMRLIGGVAADTRICTPQMPAAALPEVA